MHVVNSVAKNKDTAILGGYEQIEGLIMKVALSLSYY